MESLDLNKLAELNNWMWEMRERKAFRMIQVSNVILGYWIHLPKKWLHLRDRIEEEYGFIYGYIDFEVHVGHLNKAA